MTAQKERKQAAGRDREDWFRLLDDWGAVGRPYREIAAWLTDEHGVSAWWAQKIVVEYEQERGVRDPGARPDGTFAAGASKTIAASADQVFAAFTDADVREGWLPGAVLRTRTAQPGRSARFDWGDGPTRLSVTIATAGEGKSQVAVEHERLADAAAALDTKAFWRKRLTALKTLLED